MQLQSRRGFIGTVAAGLTAMGLAPRATFADETLGYGEFLSLKKARFYFASADGSVGGKVQLIKVEEKSTADSISQFALTFRGVRGVSLPEGTYTATNWDGLPNFDVHIVPVGVDSRDRELFLATFAQLY